MAMGRLVGPEVLVIYREKKVGLSGDLVRVSSDLVGILGALFFPDFSPPPVFFFP